MPPVFCRFSAESALVWGERFAARTGYGMPILISACFLSVKVTRAVTAPALLKLRLAEKQVAGAFSRVKLATTSLPKWSPVRRRRRVWPVWSTAQMPWFVFPLAPPPLSLATKTGPDFKPPGSARETKELHTGPVAGAVPELSVAL